MKSLSLLFILLFSIPSIILSQTTIFVPDDYETIQEGLNAATEGDTIKVSAGTYQEHIVWPNTPSLKLIGEDDPSSVVIDGQNVENKSVLFFSYGLEDSKIDSNTLISNLTITNGGGSNKVGAAIICYNANPIFKKLILRNNGSENNKIAKDLGQIEARAGSTRPSIIYVEGFPQFLDCKFLNNFTNGRVIEIIHGGSNRKIKFENCIWESNGEGLISCGMYSNVVFNNCSFLNNISTSFKFSTSGYATTEYTNCVFYNNDLAKNIGNGNIRNTNLFFNILGTLIIDNSIFYQNDIPGNIEGITRYIRNLYSDTLGNLIIMNSVFINNRSSYTNERIYDYGFIVKEGEGSITVENSLFYSNVDNGPIIYWQGGFTTDINIKNNSFVKNISSSLIELELNTGNYSDEKESIMYNNFVNNGLALMTHNEIEIFEAINNYWGAESGPLNEFENPNGTGDETSYFVKIKPFLTEPNLEAPLIPIRPNEISWQKESDYEYKVTWDFKYHDLADGYYLYYDTTNTKNYLLDEWDYLRKVNVGKTNEYVLKDLVSPKHFEHQYVWLSWYTDSSEESSLSSPIPVLITVDVKDKEKSLDFQLAQNYPNPFNPTTTIQFSIPKYSQINITIYNSLGEKKEILLDEYRQAGNHQIYFDGSDLSSGVYFYQIIADEFIDTKKMVLIK